MDHIACHLCAGSSFSLQPVASGWHTKLSSVAGHSMHRAAGDVVAVFCIRALFDLEGISSSRLYFPCVGSDCIFRLSLRPAVRHHVDSLLKSFACPYDFPVAQDGEGGHSFPDGNRFDLSDRNRVRRGAVGIVCAARGFPANIIANMFNFTAAELFLIQNASERATPEASFT
jgi:hypothetical protein